MTTVDNPLEVWAEPGVNPARWSDSVLDLLRTLIPRHLGPGEMVFDPFAGDGTKLGELCEQIGVPFAGADLVDWKGRTTVVQLADSTLPCTYPAGPFMVVTSPTYNNGINDGFIPRDASRRITYTVAAGRRLHPNNTGRWSGRSGPRAEREYWRLHSECVKHWPATVLVNVKDSIRDHDVYPLVAMWKGLLMSAGFHIVGQEYAQVPGHRFGQNHAARLDDECVLIARRT